MFDDCDFGVNIFQTSFAEANYSISTPIALIVLSTCFCIKEDQFDLSQFSTRKKIFLGFRKFRPEFFVGQISLKKPLKQPLELKSVNI